MTYDNIRKITTSQDDKTTVFFLDRNFFKNHYKMIAIDSTKQQALDADPKAMQQVTFTGNLGNNTVMFFIIEEVKKKFQIFHKEL